MINTMYNEIGSEFWNCGPTGVNKVFLLSGRTALEFIIRDVIKTHKIESALLPSYCCHTMIEPFIRHNISVRFYDVFFDEENGLSVEIPEIHKKEIFYFITYFGFSKLANVDVTRIKRDAEIIIEDRTHSWLNETKIINADYTYVSYRKWSGFNAIAVACKNNPFSIEKPVLTNSDYCNLRKLAFLKKHDYMENRIGEKQDYLDLFSKAENLLETDYTGYAPEKSSLTDIALFDKSYVANCRRRNAKALIDGMKEINGIHLMFNHLDECDVPLFVPILVDKNRTELRNYLISKAIYCPIHWPISEYHNGISSKANDLYNRELSLICDQRYDINDMLYIVECIRNFYRDYYNE